MIDEEEEISVEEEEEEFVGPLGDAEEISRSQHLDSRCQVQRVEV